MICNRHCKWGARARLVLIVVMVGTMFISCMTAPKPSSPKLDTKAAFSYIGAQLVEANDTEKAGIPYVEADLPIGTEIEIGQKGQYFKTATGDALIKRLKDARINQGVGEPKTLDATLQKHFASVDSISSSYILPIWYTNELIAHRSAEKQKKDKDLNNSLSYYLFTTQIGQYFLKSTPDAERIVRQGDTWQSVKKYRTRYVPGFPPFQSDEGFLSNACIVMVSDYTCTGFTEQNNRRVAIIDVKRNWLAVTYYFGGDIGLGSNVFSSTNRQTLAWDYTSKKFLETSNDVQNSCIAKRSLEYPTAFIDEKLVSKDLASAIKTLKTGNMFVSLANTSDGNNPLAAIIGGAAQAAAAAKAKKASNGVIDDIFFKMTPTEIVDLIGIFNTQAPLKYEMSTFSK